VESSRRAHNCVAVKRQEYEVACMVRKSDNGHIEFDEIIAVKA